MTKQIRLLAALAGALAVLLAVYFGLSYYNSGEADRQAAAKARVAEVKNATSLFVTNEYGSYTFEKSENGWTVSGEEDFLLAQSYPSAIAAGISSLVSVRSFAPEADLAAYGLDTPALTLTAQNESGSATVLIGDKTGDDYYAMREGEPDTIYTISAELPEQMSYSLLKMAQKPSLPTMSENNIASISLESEGNRFLLTRQAVTASASSAAGESAAETSYSWSVNGQSVDADNAALTGYLGALADAAVSDCCRYQPTAAELTACGFDSPAVLRVTLSDGSEVVLRFGAAAGDSRYLQTGDTQYIWQMDASTADILTGTTRATLAA